MSSSSPTAWVMSRCRRSMISHSASSISVPARLAQPLPATARRCPLPHPFMSRRAPSSMSRTGYGLKAVPTLPISRATRRAFPKGMHVAPQASPAARGCSRITARGGARAQRASRGGFHVRSYRLHLMQSQVLRHAVHNGDVAHIALERGELLQQVLGMLTGESREVRHSVRIGPVTGAARGDAFRFDAVFIDLAPARDQSGIPARARFGL